MKSIILILCLCSAYLFGQTHKGVYLRSQLVGEQKKGVAYYHPVEGFYSLSTPKYLPTKKQLKELSNFVLINPYDHLTGSRTEVTTNSLRYRVDPSELVYVNWQLGYDTLNNQAKLDSFKTEAKKIREEKYLPYVLGHFEPFMISKYEITNGEYREFVRWVQDSIFREALYYSDELSDEEAIKFLNYDGDPYFDEEEMDWIEPDISDREVNREYYSLNFEYNYKKELKGEQIIRSIEAYYLRPNERWYKRRELDVKTLNYSYYTIERVEDVDSLQLKSNQSAIRFHQRLFIEEHKVNVYPDTLCWVRLRDVSLNPVMANLYFWHPAFDDYPVVGVSYNQAQAFVNWKEQRMKAENPEIFRHYRLSLPSARHYEWTVLNGDASWSQNISDLEISTDLRIGYDKNDPVEKLGMDMAYTTRVYSAFDPSDPKEVKRINNLLKKGYIEPANLSRGNDEWLRQLWSVNYLESGVEYLSNNVSEWLTDNYEDHFEKVAEAYINYNCFSDVDYCHFQRLQDQMTFSKADENGQMVMGSNWYDPRYNIKSGVNTEGIYAKTFAHPDSAYATVGFRLVLVPKP